LLVAYILAEVEAGKDKELQKEIKKIPGVKQVVSTYGNFDLHIEVMFGTMEELDRFIFDDIRMLDGIKETVTLIAAEDHEDQ
jgi:DNA-binding Lrp family transcriptional regulator